MLEDADKSECLYPRDYFFNFVWSNLERIFVDIRKKMLQNYTDSKKLKWCLNLGISGVVTTARGKKKSHDKRCKEKLIF